MNTGDALRSSWIGLNGRDGSGLAGNTRHTNPVVIGCGKSRPKRAPTMSADCPVANVADWPGEPMGDGWAEPPIGGERISVALPEGAAGAAAGPAAGANCCCEGAKPCNCACPGTGVNSANATASRTTPRPPARFMTILFNINRGKFKPAAKDRIATIVTLLR